MDFKMGDTVRFDCVWEYMGPAAPTANNIPRIRASIGTKVLGVFGERLYYDTAINMPETPSWESFSQTLPIIIDDSVNPGETYGIEVKIYEYPWPSQIIYLFYEEPNIITIIEESADFANLSVSISKG